MNVKGIVLWARFSHNFSQVLPLAIQTAVIKQDRFGKGTEIMKSNYALSTTRLIAGLAFAALASSAFAASTWSSTSCAGNNLDGYGNSFSCAGTNSGPTAAVTAWSSTTSSTSGYQFATASLDTYSGGFGVANRVEGLSPGSPAHSTDNYANGVTDLVAFSFSSSVILNQFKLGWSSTDADVSVLRYVGAATSLATAISGRTVANLVANGWELVGNYGNAASSSTITQNFNAGNKSSSWWLVSAYGAYTANSSTERLGSVGTGSSDYVKILAVSGDKAPPPPQVPEPGSLVLMGVALLGALGMQRRKAKA
jgi:hypothetical protein